jgi:hypothetical protein
MATSFARTNRALDRDSPQTALLALVFAAALLMLWLLWFALSTVTLYEV